MKLNTPTSQKSRRRDVLKRPDKGNQQTAGTLLDRGKESKQPEKGLKE